MVRLLLVLVDVMVLESRGFQPLHKRVRSVGLRVKDKQEVGGVYEYQSEDGSPPPELAALFGVEKKRSSSKSSEKVYTPRKPREKNYKSEKERRIEKRMRKETQAEARKTGMRRGPAETTNDLDSLENELLGKYGAKEYRELEAGWEDDEDDDAPPCRGREKTFTGFNPSSAPAKKQSETEKRGDLAEAEETEAKFFKSLKTMHKEEQRVSAGGMVKQAPDASYDIEELWEDIEGKEDVEGGDEDDEESVSAWLGADPVSRVQREREVKPAPTSRSGPLNAVHGFRLRKPIPLTLEQQAKIDAKCGLGSQGYRDEGEEEIEKGCRED